jgi:hypothetical protein
VRAVWSFWTKPFYAHHRRVWLSDFHHLLAWVLSVGAARRHYPDTALITDELGARLLADRLGLPFDHVSTGLAELRDADPQWWVLGKLWAYRAQDRAFLHIDNDVFLWNPLPEALTQAPVFAQNPEWFPIADGSWYRPEAYDHAIRAGGGWVPDEWSRAVAARRNRAVCCGFLGGNAVDFLRYYAGTAMRMIRHPANQAAWAGFGSTVSDNILIEQYLLAACIDYHRKRGRSEYRGANIRYLFRSSREAFNGFAAARAGYTHLIGAAKNNPALARRLEERVARDYPSYFETCAKLARDDKAAA